MSETKTQTNPNEADTMTTYDNIDAESTPSEYISDGIDAIGYVDGEPATWKCSDSMPDGSSFYFCDDGDQAEFAGIIYQVVGCEWVEW